MENSREKKDIKYESKPIRLDGAWPNISYLNKVPKYMHKTNS